MELSRTIVLEIATLSQRVVGAATEYARRKGLRNVQSCHFRLEKEMQRISVAAGGILGVISKSSLPNGPPLDDRLEEWFSTNELPMCLDTLHQMEGMLQNDTWVNTVFNFAYGLRSAPLEDKIDAAVKLFDSRRNYFHFLLTTDVWNCEEAQQQPRARLAHSQDNCKQVVEPTPEPNSNVMEVDQDKVAVPSSTDTTGSITEESKQMDSLRKIDDILRWLDGLSCAAKQEETLSLRQPDTCTWLHSTPEYKSWRAGDNPSLWLQGKPGSGKTVLASFVVDSLKSQRHNEEALAFFYCDFRNDRSTSAAEVMRSLLSQLLHHIRNGGSDAGELTDNLVREKNSDTPILQNVKHLAAFVSQAARGLGHAIIVVDALDECKDVEKLLDGLLTLAKDGVRLFATSRPLQIIKDGLHTLHSISMDKMTSAVSADIALHVTGELDSRRRLRDLELGLKTEIRSILCDRADGMFRWVQCQIDTLNRCATKAEVREALENLPIGLDETYERILVAIDTESPEGKLALRTLVWLVGALRPLRLVEILEGLTIDLERRTMDPETGPMHKGALLDACSSLVIHNEETGVLILSHFSVKEYLTGDLTRMKLPRYHINYQSAHEHLARLCICYIALYLKHVHESTQENSLLSIMQIINGRPHLQEESRSSFPVSQELLCYVFPDGFNHLAYLGSTNRVVLKDMVALQSDIQRHTTAWEVVRRMSQRYKASVPWPCWEHDFMPYILVAFASDSLLHAFLGPRRRLLVPKDQTNSLVYAAHFGRSQHAQLLLAHGANVNKRGLVVDGSRHALPLEVAVSRQHDAMVDLLLSAGSVVPKQLFALSMNHNFPIRIARRLVQTDEFMEWATEPGNRLLSPARLLERRPPLAYESDMIIMIRRLVQAGSDPAAHSSAPSRKTALHLAVEGGYQAVVVYLFLIIGIPFPSDIISAVFKITSSQRLPMLRLVVDLGANIRVKGNKDIVLQPCIWSLQEDECLGAIRILVDAGCNLRACNAVQKTPLHLALEQGYSLVADYLLSKMVPSDALLVVVESRCPTTWVVDILRTLIGKGEDIHALTIHGDTLLHRAVGSADEHRGLEVAKVLLSAGCDLSKTSANRKTALDLALDRKYSLVADYLLSKVERPPPPDVLFSVLYSALPAPWRARKIRSLIIDQGGNAFAVSADRNTLLHAAVLTLDHPQNLEVAKFLTTIGCGPFEKNAQGKTTLDLALDHKDPFLVDFLLSAGGSLPPDALFSVLCSALPVDWRARIICALVDKGADASMLSADGNTLLHSSLLSLDEPRAIEVAKLLISSGCDPSKRNARGETPLDLAFSRRYSHVADYLLSTRGPFPPNVLSALLRSAFPKAWKVEKMVSLVGKGADVRGVSNDGNALLHDTVLFCDESGALEVAKLLVGAGCDPFGCNVQGKTPLNLALDHKFPLLADYLLSTGRPFPLDTPFTILRSQLPSPWKAQKIRCHIARGAKVPELSAADGSTLLHAAVLWLDDSQALSLAIYLVGAGYNPFASDTQRITPLDLALDRKHSLLADYLLSSAKPPANALFAILRSKLSSVWKAETVFSLLRKGVDISELSVDGNTLLHDTVFYLCERQALEVAKFLVSTGHNPFKCNLHGKTCLDLALDRMLPLLVNYLLSIMQPPGPVNVLLTILQSGGFQSDWRARAICSLVEKGVDATEILADGGTLLHATVRSLDEHEALQVAKLLIGAGCTPDERQRTTTLHMAAERGFNTVMEYFLSLDESLPDNILFSVLKSRSLVSVPMLRMLISKGANVHAVSVGGNNLLHVALSQRSSYLRRRRAADTRTVVVTLIESGCDAFAANSHGKTPLHLAVTEGRVSIVKYLLSIATPSPLPSDILACALDREVTYIRWRDIRDILQLLVDKGANVHARAANRDTLLHIAIGKWVPTPLPTHSVERDLLQSPLSMGATVWTESDSLVWTTARIILNDKGPGVLLDVVKFFIDSGCDPSQCDASGHPPVYYAIAKGYLAVAKHLLPRTVANRWELEGAVRLAPKEVQEYLEDLLKEWIQPRLATSYICTI